MQADILEACNMFFLVVGTNILYTLNIFLL